jgi:adenylate cyclase class IV
MANIELEYRALITKQKHTELLEFLAKNGEDLGEDDKDVFFFLVPGKILKVVNNVSQKTAKIVLKLNSIGNGGDFEELEIPIDPREVDKSVELFEKLELAEMMRSFQKRHNYMYKGVEIAVKYSEHWQYHAELEILIDDLDQKSKAKKRIFDVAEQLGLKIMGDKQLKAFVARLENNYRTKHSKQ